MFLFASLLLLLMLVTDIFNKLIILYLFLPFDYYVVVFMLLFHLFYLKFQRGENQEWREKARKISDDLHPGQTRRLLQGHPHLHGQSEEKGGRSQLSFAHCMNI